MFSTSPAGAGLYSYSKAVGSGSGSAFATEGQGRITGIRLWERTGAYITGSVSYQLFYACVWDCMKMFKMGIRSKKRVDFSSTERRVHLNFYLFTYFVASLSGAFCRRWC